MNIDELKIYLEKYFVYNQDGTLSRLDRKGSNGSHDRDGYLIVKIKGKQYKAHRLVYLMHNGYLPDEVDHINRIRDDNRIENLRHSNRCINHENTFRGPNPDTGVVGIYKSKLDGLLAVYCFRYNGKNYRFRTLDEAIKAKVGMIGDQAKTPWNPRGSSCTERAV